MKCRDCGIEVTYNDEGMWPWLGVDGSDTCPLHEGEVYNCHFVTREEADAAFVEHRTRTGQVARHR